jgi:hypothetical protein
MIELTADGRVLMTGPAVIVAEGEWRETKSSPDGVPCHADVLSTTATSEV